MPCATVSRSSRSQLELGALTSAVPCARSYTKAVLAEWGLSALTDDAEHVVSELVTNAVEASASGTAVRLTLAAGEHHLRIEVWDSSLYLPAPQPHEIDSDGGRGIEIVAALCSGIGVIPRDRGGKTVWAILSLPAGEPA